MRQTTAVSKRDVKTAANKADLGLTRAEVLLIRGLKAQEELIALKAQLELDVLRADMAHVRGSIEKRLKLKAGQIKEDYQIDLNTGQLVPL